MLPDVTNHWSNVISAYKARLASAVTCRDTAQGAAELRDVIDYAARAIENSKENFDLTCDDLVKAGVPLADAKAKTTVKRWSPALHAHTMRRVVHRQDVSAEVALFPAPAEPVKPGLLQRFHDILTRRAMPPALRQRLATRIARRRTRLATATTCSEIVETAEALRIAVQEARTAIEMATGRCTTADLVAIGVSRGHAIEALTIDRDAYGPFAPVRMPEVA